MKNNKDLIQSLPTKDLAEFLQKFVSETYGTLCESTGSVQDKDRESQICNIERWLREAVRPEEPNHVLLELEVCFYTDGDFSFTGAESLFNPQYHMYRGAVIKYNYDTAFEYFGFRLSAEGDERACSCAAKDLLERLTCRLSTCRCYIVRDVCNMLIPAIEQCLWNDKAVSEYESSMGGNYDGTSINLKIVRNRRKKN